MSLFTTITKGMADGAEALQANFAKLATAITSIGDDGTMTVPKLKVNNLEDNSTPVTTNAKFTIAQSGGFITLTKVGRFVMMFANYAPTNDVSANTNIGTLPAGYAPAGTVFSKDTGNSNTRLRFTNDGVITASLAQTAGQYHVSYTMWVTAK
ncbi:hypothetical protein EFL69_04440 [Weissella confusa]|uniref:hypothetical protein n=1 Tax=Weissella confusa TaxID=1583 RepID=UPI00223B452F|nr:hypothetical protein [Weissella confusa]MCS9992350.1 hypothetical protein [Weissella confusa]